MSVGRALRLMACLALLASCGGASAPSKPPDAPARACEDAYDDLAKYFTSDPDRRRPPAFREDTFISACRELPPLAQRCLLFSYMQSHASECDEAMARVPPDVMRRIAAMTGK